MNPWARLDGAWRSMLREHFEALAYNDRALRFSPAMIERTLRWAASAVRMSFDRAGHSLH